MSLKSTLDNYQGHRTFLLVLFVVVPFTIKGLIETGADLVATLQFMGPFLRDACFGLGASKFASAVQTYSRNGSAVTGRLRQDGDNNGSASTSNDQYRADSYEGATRSR